MKSSRASSTGSGFLPDSGADPASTNGPADTATGTATDGSGASADTAAGAATDGSGGYGPGGPLGVDAVWTAPVGAPSDAPSESPTGFGARVGSGGGLAGLSGRVVLTA
ncbi:hypothetical protein ACX80A_12130, partial [Arthrobacter sp. TMN-50]